MQSDHCTATRQLHRKEGAAVCCSGARGSSAFVVRGSELVDVVQVVVSADEGGDDDRRIEADPGEKSNAENAASMRMRDGWACILVE